MSLLRMVVGNDPVSVAYEAPLPDTGRGPAWAEPVHLAPCRIERATKRIQTSTGAVVVTTAKVFTPGTPEVEIGGRIDLGDGTGARLVHAVDAPVWLSGKRMHHEVLLA